MISTRHIRHDWKTFVDWEQNTVRTVCGVTTRRNLAGIPGITEQPKVVDKGGKRVWGWCAICVRSTFPEAESIVENPLVADNLKLLYDFLLDAIEDQFDAINQK